MAERGRELCVCGHSRSDHGVSGTQCKKCDCGQFRPEPVNEGSRVPGFGDRNRR